MQIKVNVSKEIIDWVMTQISIDSIPTKVIETLISWRDGTKQPTYNQIENISKSTGIPFGYFFLKTPPIENFTLLEYRTIDSVELMNPSRELLDTIHYIEEIQEWIKNDILSIGGSNLNFVGSCANINDIKTIANNIRHIIDLKENWYESLNTIDLAFNHIRSLISNSGVTVMMSGIVGNNTRRTLSIDEFRAFAIVDEIAPIIFINSNDSKGAKIFSLLHEFVHVCLGENSLFNTNKYNNVSGTEQICNAVAAEILVPTNAFLSKWNKDFYDESFSEKISSLSKFFKCGETVVARKALDNKLINVNQYCEIAEQAKNNYIEYKKRQKEKESGGSYYNTLTSRIDKSFLNRLLSSVYEGRTQYTEAFRLTNTNRSTFSKMVSKVGGVV